MAYQFVKCGKETSRDLEYAIVNNGTAKAEDTVPARFGGVTYFLEATKPVEAIATTGVFTVTGHGFFNGDPVILMAAPSGAIDAKYSTNTPYYVHVVDANSFTVHVTPQDTMMSNYADLAIKPSAAVVTGKMLLTNQNLIDAATSASKGSLTFDLLNDAMQITWKRGGAIDSIVCSGKNKRKISGFTQGVQKTRDMSRKDLVEVVDVNCFDCIAA